MTEFSVVLRTVGFATVVATVLMGSGIARAQDAAAAITPPTDPVAKAAFDVLDRNCSRCHQDGKLISRERPAKNFGNILKLDELAVNPNYILPGNPLGSKLFRKIADKEMPYDIIYEGETKYPDVTEADLKALQDWITALGTTAVASCESHKFITPEDMVAFMAADLDKVQRVRQAATRYLTLTHLANICVDANTMKVYREGAIKLINSLGRSSDVVKLETIDPEGTILRINLTDLGWTATDWDNILTIYPYFVEPDIQLTNVLSAATGTPLPYLRADWFVFTAAQPPLYDTLLNLANSFQGLTRDQGIDVDGDIRNFVAQRAAFQKSGVSQNNRMIERHPSRSGYFWTSYDFAGNRDHQNLFEFPLGPSAAGFQHNGGETIFSLPNGFQGYYLALASGQRLDKGPTQIVSDPSRKDLAVTNGISCMGCHDQGMRKAKDEIRDSVAGNRAFSRDDRQTVDGLYPPHDKMDAFIDGDAKRFADALTRAGLEPTLKLNGVEMINVLSKHYENDLDVTLAASEFGLTKDEFKQFAGDADRRFQTLIRRLEQNSLPRDEFELVFADIAVDITDLKAVPGVGGQLQKAHLVADHSLGDLSLTSDADTYKVGDTPIFTIVPSRDCFLTLTDVDEKGVGTVLLPNGYQQDNKVHGGSAVQFPSANAPYRYRMNDPGTETVVAVCSEKPDGGDAIKHDFSRSVFTSVPNYTAAISRSIKIESAAAPGSAAPSSSAPSSPATTVAPIRPVSPAGAPSASFRAAIRLRVQ